jgi:hypothetical protein
MKSHGSPVFFVVGVAMHMNCVTASFGQQVWFDWHTNGLPRQSAAPPEPAGDAPPHPGPTAASAPKPRATVTTTSKARRRGERKA